MIRSRPRITTRAGALALAAVLLLSSAAQAWDPGASPRAHAPRLLEPAHGTVLDGLPVLRWEPVPGTMEYMVEISRDPDFGIGSGGGSTVLPFLPVTTLGPGTWFWRVRVADLNHQVRPYSATRSFTVRPVLTAAPALEHPADGGTLAAPDDLDALRWSQVPAASGYEVEFAADAAFTADVTSSRGYLPILLPPLDRLGARMYWRVRAFRGYDWQEQNAIEHGPWSSARSFVVVRADPPSDPPPVTQVELLSPADGAVVEGTLETVLRWKPDPGARGYEVQSLPDEVEFHPTLPPAYTEVTLNVPSDWAEPGLRKWRVRSIDADGVPGPWSNTWRYTIPPTAGPTGLIPPDGGNLLASDGVVHWTSPATAPRTRLFFSRSPAFDDWNAIIPWGPLLGDRLSAGLRAGTWYWRAYSLGDPAIGTTEGGTLTVVDDVPPSGLAQIDGRGPTFVDATWTALRVRADLRDAHGEPGAFRVSPDGVTWTVDATGIDGWDFDIPIQDPAWGGTTPGRRDVWVAWEDTAGNRSEPVRLSYWFETEPPGMPSAPRVVTGTPRDGAVTVRWQPPLETGGWPITSYDVQVSPSAAGCSTTGTLSCTVTGLTNGTSYAFTVRARNDAYEGPASEPSPAVTPQFVAVNRYAGPDRFATAAAVSAATFNPGVPVAFVANAYNFPDALGGAAAAGSLDAPVLLVAATGALHPATVAELQRLQPAKIVVLGGTAMVSTSVLNALKAYATGGG